MFVSRRPLATLALLLTVLSTALLGQVTQFPNCIQVQASTIATTGGRLCSGTGTPESAVTGWIGDLFLRRDGSTSTTLYIKESGAGTNTGWAAVGGALSSTPQFTRVGVGMAAHASAALAITGQIYTAEVSLGNMGATETVTWDAGNQQRGVLDANCTFTFTNPQQGGRYLLILTQDGTGSRTVTWPASVKWSAGTAPTLTTTASATDLCTFAYTGAASGVYLAACNLDIR